MIDYLPTLGADANALPSMQLQVLLAFFYHD
jgi:hypothetical protein